MSEEKQIKYGIMAFDSKPNEKDITSIDGGFMYGYRKVHCINNVGYIKAGGVKFGHKELAQYKNKWVYVDASLYWATSAKIGYGKVSQSIIMSGIKCEFLEKALQENN